MCGIAGLWASGMTDEERAHHVARMLRALGHRGPSGVAVWGEGGVTLGLSRLAIVAPRTPAQIARNPEGTVHAVMNGEIYNHRALRGELLRRGHVVEEGVDTAVLPALYETEGLAFPDQLDGMFAIAVWDARVRRLTLVRDRAGEKPLFVSSSVKGLAFASEPGALAALPWVSRDPAPEALARYLVHGYFAGEDCAFASLRQVPPAHVVTFEAGAERRVRYWRPWDPPRRTAVSVAEAPARTREALRRAVRSRMPDEVPFGVFLSGGVDSSLVAVLAAAESGRRLPTFCLRLTERGYDESGYARQVAQLIRSDHHELTLSRAGGEEALESFASTMDQPLGDPSLLPTWAIARLASRHVPVVLTGEGGDELFAGYPTYFGHRWASWAAMLPYRGTLHALARAARPKHTHLSVAHFLDRFLESAALPPFERHLSWFGTSRPDEALSLLAPGLRARVAPRAPLAHVDAFAAALERAGAGARARSPRLTEYQFLDFETYLSGDLLTKVDRCAMAHGVESRAPFLQHDLIEFAFALPEKARLRGAVGKWALKRAAHDLLPEKLLHRRKQGFSPPFSVWARGPLAALVRSRLAYGRVARAGVLDPDAVGRVLDEHLSGHAERGRTLWALLSLQMWAEAWCARDASSVPPAPAAHESDLVAQPMGAAQVH
ncbi:MAG TPA: asparagine synthase (glutamine-hydrolyzing) [Candidatus Saccharimonadaceae bacterium]|jgi:asparagine synthase (glutamine-hydrolysing)|nr:asparagine synthase (glutamine-hydrolyzing) [Candidatus Saccharimonadaceae bacterium]